MTGEIVHQRCTNGHACSEVTSRVLAGQQALHFTGCPEQGLQLLATTRRIAGLHGHGSGALDPLEEVS